MRSRSTAERAHRKGVELLLLRIIWKESLYAMAYACGALVVDSWPFLLPSLKEALKFVRGVLYVPLAGVSCHSTILAVTRHVCILFYRLDFSSR